MSETCYVPDCGEQATRCCDVCGADCCTDHSHHFPPEHFLGETIACDKCCEEAR